MSVENKAINVVVIGAGLSGLTMAYRLNQKNYNISVYEARPRVGGRVHTVYIKDSNNDYCLAELGGQNITDGGKAENFLNLCHEHSLEINEKHLSIVRGFYSDDEVYDSQLLLKDYCLSKKDLREMLQTLSKSTNSIGDILDQLFSEDHLLKRMLTYFIGSYEGLLPEDLAINHNIAILEHFLLGDAVGTPKIEDNKDIFLLKNIKDGNSKLPLALAAALPGKVFLEKVLTKVSYYSGEIKLTFKDRTTVLCDKLILSIPCSVVKDIEWDENLISKEKLDQINQVQYGSNGKMIVPYISDQRSFRYSSIIADHIGSFHNIEGQLLVLYTDKIWGQNLEVNSQDYYSYSLKLIESNYGQQSKLLSSLTPALDILYQKYTQPVVKSWHEDSYAQGSYSGVGAVLGNRFLTQTMYKNVPVKTMFAPIEDKIFFIGEHTSLIDEVGTMEAAVESAEHLSKLF